MDKSERGGLRTDVTPHAVGDSSKVIAAKSSIAANRLRIVSVTGTVRTLAAQAVTIKDSSSTVVLATIAASAPVGSQFKLGPFRDGVALPANTDLVSTCTAGPAIDYIVESYVETL